MGTSVLVVALMAAINTGAPLRQSVVTTNNDVFERLWGTEFVWKFDDLPTEGSVPSFRVPYSGYIYPDAAGGTSGALRRYDQAFNRGRSLATSHEAWDTSAFKKPVKRRGLLGLFGAKRMETPAWHGHCNGWAAAAMRHAEPEESVRVNGVTFTPANIKALLAEIYMYNDLQYLDGLKSYINAGALHAILANWLGRGGYPIGMEADPGEEKWNYPIYGFSSSHAKRSARRVEVKVNLAYAKDSNGEYQESPRIKRIKYFHYMLELNDRGEIVGGSYYNDSNRIDMLWIPLRPKKSRTTGNESGNPYVNVEQVLAIWRKSVPEETRRKWFTVDPTDEDRILAFDEDEEMEQLVPVQIFNATPPASSAAVTVTDTQSEPDADESSPEATDDTPEGESATVEVTDDAAETAPPADDTTGDTREADSPAIAAETSEPTDATPADESSPAETAMTFPELEPEAAGSASVEGSRDDPFPEIGPALFDASTATSNDDPVVNESEVSVSAAAPAASDPVPVSTENAPAAD